MANYSNRLWGEGEEHFNLILIVKFVTLFEIILSWEHSRMID